MANINESRTPLQQFLTKGKVNPIMEYCLAQSIRLSPVQLRMQEESFNRHFMTASADVIQLNMMLMELIKAKKALEIGVFCGSNALAAVLTVPADGAVYGFEVDDEPFNSIGRKFFVEEGVEHKLKLMVGPALDNLDKLTAEGQAGTFDYAFVDADKECYDAYYERCLELLRPGGIIAIDNAFCGGQAYIYDPEKLAGKPQWHQAVKSVVALNEKIHKDQRVNCSLLPIGDGLMLAVKR